MRTRDNIAHLCRSCGAVVESRLPAIKLLFPPSVRPRFRNRDNKMIIALLIRFIHFSKLASTRKLSHDEPQLRPRWQQRLEIHETNWHVINEFITTNETRKLYIFENMKWRILYRAFQIYISSRSQTLDRPICCRYC